MESTSPAASRRSATGTASASACSARPSSARKVVLMAAMPSANSVMPRRSQKSIPSRQAARAACGPSYCQRGDREVVVQDGRGAALALLECERERPAHVLESLPLAEGGAGRPR